MRKADWRLVQNNIQGYAGAKRGSHEVPAAPVLLGSEQVFWQQESGRSRSRAGKKGLRDTAEVFLSITSPF